MIINFFIAIFLWRIDLVYGDATAATNDCSFAFENSCPDSVVDGVYFDEVPNFDFRSELYALNFV